MRISIWLIVLLAALATVLSSHADSITQIRSQNAKLWCKTYNHYFSPKQGTTLTSHCRYVRWDNKAFEVLYAVWMTTKRIPRGTPHTYFACVYFDGEQETAYVPVARVGEQGGQDC